MSRAKTPPPDSQHELAKAITAFSYRHPIYQTFADFVELAAISLNAVDLRQPWRDNQEAKYMQIVKQYTPEEAQAFCKMLAILIGALETATTPGSIGRADILGLTYHELELHNKWTGQYFSPFEICQLMAEMNVGDKEELEAKIAADGFIRLCEPACGSGAMVIAFALAMRSRGVEPQRHLHVTAVDVDLKCVAMTYIQLSLLGIPAVIVHGNSLTLEEWGHWYTPAHIMFGWGAKLRRRSNAEPAAQTETVADEPAILPEIVKATQLSLF